MYVHCLMDGRVFNIADKVHYDLFNFDKCLLCIIYFCVAFRAKFSSDGLTTSLLIVLSCTSTFVMNYAYLVPTA